MISSFFSKKFNIHWGHTAQCYNTYIPDVRKWHNEIQATVWCDIKKFAIHAFVLLYNVFH